VPEAEEGPGEAQVNFADAVENPNPTSEASETNLAQEGETFEDMIASLTWPCTLPPGWSVEWETSLANDDKNE